MLCRLGLHRWFLAHDLRGNRRERGLMYECSRGGTVWYGWRRCQAVRYVPTEE